MVEHDRIPTDIPGLDKILQGGLPKNGVFLVTGNTGAGKTLFCSQFLWNGLEKGEKGIFFSLEERTKDIIHNAETFNWNFQKHIDDKNFVLEYSDPFELSNISSLIKEKIETNEAKRVVIDSTSVLGMVSDNEHEIRKNLYQLVEALKQTGATVLLTSEIPEGSKQLSRFGVKEFVADGVILLNYENGKRTLQVRKMRGTDHGKNTYSLKIGKKGLSL